MRLIDEIIQELQLSERGSSYSCLLAQALRSACHDKYPGPSPLAISVKLDDIYASRMIGLLGRLSQITREADYSNADQDAALLWLHENGYQLS